jgi:hypothetical protein
MPIDSNATREHLIPKCLKKRGQQSQLVVAHRQCNMLRVWRMPLLSSA